jgi:hypothetical protein
MPPLFTLPLTVLDGVGVGVGVGESPVVAEAVFGTADGLETARTAASSAEDEDEPRTTTAPAVAPTSSTSPAAPAAISRPRAAGLAGLTGLAGGSDGGCTKAPPGCHIKPERTTRNKRNRHYVEYRQAHDSAFLEFRCETGHA